MAPVNPREVMDKVLDLMEGTLDAQNIAVNRDYHAGVPDLMADSRQLEQVFLNLVLNAQHAMELGGGTLTASIGYDKAADSVWFRVEDTGSGIAPENLEKIFDPFYTTKPEGKGTGLGLSTAHAVVAAHGGSISARSEPGRGAAFTVSLPRGLPGRRAGAAPDAARARRPAVLVVDDEGHIRDILKEAFESRGYAVECAGDAPSALALLRANRYRLAILDIRMPGPSGLSLLGEASSFAGPDTPVVVLTGMATEEELAEARRLGAAACMRKPFKMEELLTLSAGLMKPEGAA
jgi:CheY-like chemotaxis protein